MMTDETLQLLLHRDATVVEHALREFYAGQEPIGRLLEAEQYSLFAGGKRIRPVLTLEFCKLFGGREEAAIPFACAVEMIHTYSLIHDDLPCMDDDDLRRGKPTSHKVFGEAVAVLTGDSLLTGAFEMTATNTAVTPGIAAIATAYLANSAGRAGMVGGQILDMAGEHHQLSLDELIRLHSLKTGALIGAACVLGALAAGISLQDDAMQRVVTYAEKIGLAFQIVDDLLDQTGDEATLGKRVGVDDTHEKNTFLRFYSVEEAKYFADQLTQEAIKAVSVYPESDALIALAGWLAGRNH